MTTPRRTPPTPTRSRPDGTLTRTERLGVIMPTKGWAQTDPDIVRVFGDTGEDVGAVPFEDSCRCHRWFVAADGAQWQATELAGWDTRRRPDKGERFVVVTNTAGQSERVTRYAATPGDLRAHLAELASAAHAIAYPRDGAHAYAVAVPGEPCMVQQIRGVEDVLVFLEGMGLRPVRVGAHVALTHPVASPLMTNHGAQFHQRPGDAVRELVRDWAPLIAARLGGPAVGCDVEGCERAADSVAMGGAMICAGHLEAVVGAPAVKPPRAGILGALASAIGG